MLPEACALPERDVPEGSLAPSRLKRRALHHIDTSPKGVICVSRGCEPAVIASIGRLSPPPLAAPDQVSGFYNSTRTDQPRPQSITLLRLPRTRIGAQARMNDTPIRKTISQMLLQLGNTLTKSLAYLVPSVPRSSHFIILTLTCDIPHRLNSISTDTILRVAPPTIRMPY